MPARESLGSEKSNSRYVLKIIASLNNGHRVHTPEGLEVEKKKLKVRWRKDTGEWSDSETIPKHELSAVSCLLFTSLFFLFLLF